MNLLKLITPTNLKTQQERFFSEENYHPVFDYSWEKTKIIYKNSNPSKQTLITAILDQKHDEITNSAKQYFETNLDDYQLIAKEIISDFQRDKVTIKTPTLDEFAIAFQHAFKLLKLDYKLEIVDETGFNFRPKPKDKKIIMSRHADFQFFDIEGEIRHELTHIIRYENSKFNKISPSQNYLPTEEGLATLMQDTGPNGISSQFQHAAEYMASVIGSQGSLRDMYDYLREIGFNPELA